MVEFFYRQNATGSHQDVVKECLHQTPRAFMRRENPHANHGGGRELRQGADRARCEVCYHETDPDAPCHMFAEQGQCAEPHVNPLVPRLFAHVMWVIQTTNTALKWTVFLQAVKDYNQDSKLATSQHFIRSRRSTTGRTNTVLRCNSFVPNFHRNYLHLTYVFDYEIATPPEAFVKDRTLSIVESFSKKRHHGPVETPHLVPYLHNLDVRVPIKHGQDFLSDTTLGNVHLRNLPPECLLKGTFLWSNQSTNAIRSE